MGFPRQEYWNGLPFPSPGDLPDPGIEPASPAMAAGFISAESHGKPHIIQCAQLLSHGLPPTINNVSTKTDMKTFILDATVSSAVIRHTRS